MIKIITEDKDEALELERMINAWDWSNRFGDLHWRVEGETLYVWGYQDQFEENLIEAIKEDSSEHRVFIKKYVEV